MVRCTGQPRRHTRDRWFNPYSLCGVPATLCLQRTIVTHDTSVVGVLHGPVYSLGAPLRNCNVKKRGPDLARRQAKKNTEPRRV